MREWAKSFNFLVPFKLIAEGLSPTLGNFTVSMAQILSWPIKGFNEMNILSYIGKLGLKEEAAGKVRVFAMVDCITQ